MIDIEQLIRPHIKKLVPYSSARDEFTGDKGVFLDANENPYGDLNRYPDPYQTKLKKELGMLNNIRTESIFVGNGSDEIIDLLFRVFCKPGSDKAMVFEPTFGMYATSARINDVELLRMKLNENFQIDLDEVKSFMGDTKLKLIFICSPNNPTGNVINNETIEYLLQHFEGMLAIDEAYIDFSSSESWVQVVKDYPNLIVLQTLSKAWGGAGLRIGMAFADARVVRYLNKVKPPYNISSANQQLALEKLKNRKQYQKQVESILTERKRVAEALANLDVVRMIYPSDANFILVEVGEAEKVYDKLLKQGIIVRNRGSQVENCLRITIGSPRENDYLITAFKNLKR